MLLNDLHSSSLLFYFFFYEDALSSGMSIVEATQPNAVTHTNIIIGIGCYTSANIGDNTVAVFAPTLQNPKAVPAKMAGNKKLFAK